MNIALLSGANPKRCIEGPVVRLLPGTWQLDVHGREDSTIIMHVEGYEATNEIRHNMTFVAEEVLVVQLKFGVRGREEYINVTAQKVA